MTEPADTGAYVLIALLVLLGACSVTDGGIACMREADTEAGERACADLYPAVSPEYQACLDAGGSFTLRDHGTQDYECWQPGEEPRR